MSELAGWLVAILAGLPAALTLLNLPLLRRPVQVPCASGPRRRISVLIPARDEEANIGAALESVLADSAAELEVIVLDDDSSDSTAAIVAAYAARDARVRLLRGEPLEAGAWGKPVACARLAEAARGEQLVFMDADVRLEPGALRRLGAALERSSAAMLSGVPRQITLTWSERLVVPLIHLVLLGFLPLPFMRASRHPGFGVAVGQLLIVARETYSASGGHRSVADKVHDGMALARALRRAGYHTDLADFTDIAHCRMYRSWPDVRGGFAKNAHEGLGSLAGIIPWTVLLIGGQAAWLPLLPLALFGVVPTAPIAVAATLSLGTRVLLAVRFKQPLFSIALHPVGVALLVAIQWWALGQRLTGRPVAWKRRTTLLPPAPAATTVKGSQPAST